MYATSTGARKYLWAGSNFYPNSIWQTAASYGTVWTHDYALTNHLANYPTYYIGVGYYARVVINLWSEQRQAVVQAATAPNIDSTSTDYCSTSVYATFPQHHDEAHRQTALTIGRLVALP
jgi:hypothetical protein